MATDSQPTAKMRHPSQVAGTRRARDLARRALWRVAPAYARRRASRVGTIVAVQRLEADFDHLRKRHTEQIERLETLVRELVLTAEALRREIAHGERRDSI
jgi:hypothetical protein